MGSGAWRQSDWQDYARSTKSAKRPEEIFRNNDIKEYLNPMGITLRESCDGVDNPESNALIIGLDITGSMGFIAQEIAQHGLDTVVRGILDRKPVTNPHVMIMAIGDARTDRAPLQVTQFEADIRIAEQLKDIYLEGNGGGNGSESYDLPWYFAGKRTIIDCVVKRGKKGYLFTSGDEGTPAGLTQKNLVKVFGKGEERDFKPDELLKLAEEKYHVFHVIVEQGDYASRHLESVIGQWRKLLGKRAVLLSNYKHFAEVILSVIEVSEGKEVDDVIASWEDPDTRETVKHALYD